MDQGKEDVLTRGTGTKLDQAIKYQRNRLCSVLGDDACTHLLVKGSSMQNSCVEVRRFGEKCKHLNVTSRIANQLIMMTNWAAHDENAYRDKKWKHTKVTDAHIERTLSILAELITSIIDNKLTFIKVSKVVTLVDPNKKMDYEDGEGTEEVNINTSTTVIQEDAYEALQTEEVDETEYEFNPDNVWEPPKDMQRIDLVGDRKYTLTFPVELTNKDYMRRVLEMAGNGLSATVYDLTDSVNDKYGAKTLPCVEGKEACDVFYLLKHVKKPKVFKFFVTELNLENPCRLSECMDYLLEARNTLFHNSFDTEKNYGIVDHSMESAIVLLGIFSDKDVTGKLLLNKAMLQTLRNQFSRHHAYKVWRMDKLGWSNKKKPSTLATSMGSLDIKSSPNGNGMKGGPSSAPPVYPEELSNAVIALQDIARKHGVKKKGGEYELNLAQKSAECFESWVPFKQLYPFKLGTLCEASGGTLKMEKESHLLYTSKEEDALEKSEA